MNEEIKEILDRLERIDHKEYSCGFEFADSGSFDEDCRCFEERKKLADYITNLQEEIHKKDVYIKYLEEYNPKYYKGKKYYGDAREVLQQRIDKAIEYIKEYCIDDEFYINLTNKEKSIIEVLNILGGDNDE